MRTCRVILLLWIALGITGNVCAASEHDYLLPLRDPHVDAHANDVRFQANSAVLTTRVLLAGDSWARYMWTDGSHNDIFDRYGHGDFRALSAALTDNPGPGYTGPEYAVTSSEARQWVDTANFPWIANTLDALQSNPEIDAVVLSIGGNDILAGKSDGGWYKDMDLDVPGSEAAVFAQLQNNTTTIIDAILAVRPNIEVVISSYDYPNFNVGFWCFLSACPMRNNLSRDPSNDLITDEEINAMLITAEAMRIALANANERVHYDHSLGLMHYYFGDGVAAPLTLARPGQTPPLYKPSPGGNPLHPSLRSLFRRPSGLDADPIHLDYEAYQYKITNHLQSWFLPRLRADVTESFFSEGSDRDGWTDGSVVDNSIIALGDNGASVTYGIVSFDTSSIPDGATITGASLYLHRTSQTGANPFMSSNLGLLAVDVMQGSFGAPALEASDVSVVATASGAAAEGAIGSAVGNGYVIRIPLQAAGFEAINDAGTTQFRIAFANPGEATGADYVAFYSGSAAPPPVGDPPNLADYLGSPAPLLDVSYDAATDVAEGAPRPARVFYASPNPFNPRTTISFGLDGHEQRRVSLTAYDAAGRKVRTLLHGSKRAPGLHSVVWDGRDDQGRSVASGVYHLRLSTPAGSQSLKSVLLK